MTKCAEHLGISVGATSSSLITFPILHPSSRKRSSQNPISLINSGRFKSFLSSSFWNIYIYISSFIIQAAIWQVFKHSLSSVLFSGRGSVGGTPASNSGGLGSRPRAAVSLSWVTFRGFPQSLQVNTTKVFYLSLGQDLLFTRTLQLLII